MTKRSFLSFSCLLMLVLTLLSATVSQSANAATLAATGNTQATEIQPRTDGKTVVWTSYLSGNSWNGDVYAADLTHGSTFTVTTGALDQAMPDVSGNIIVWEQGQPCPQGGSNNFLDLTTSDWTNCNRDIYAKSLATGQSFAVANTANDETDPAISGNWVVWVDKSSSGQYSLQARNISTMAGATTLAPINTAFFTHRVAIDGTRVVWGETGKTDANGFSSWRLLTMRIGQDTTPQVVDTGTIDNQVFSWDVHGDTVVYSFHNGAFNLKVADVKNNNKFTPNFPNHELPSNATTDGRYIFFEDYSTFTATNGKVLALGGYDLSTGSIFRVTLTNNTFSSWPYLRDGILVWQRGYYQSTQTAIASLAMVLPTAPVTAPATSNPDISYFPETGHSLSYGFNYFWNHSGGLPVFGYPLTEEFTESNYDNGKFYTVQYFERERFEYHPEFKGTPYETELGRLGVLDAQQRNLLDTKPFQPANNNQQSGCTYFPQTQHNVCGQFAAYWSSHGLDFGDAGTSFRESLALFGYPISEPFTDSQTGLTVQYFERARFELYPQFAGTANEVELGLLGKQLLQLRGWQ